MLLRKGNESQEKIHSSMALRDVNHDTLFISFSRGGEEALELPSIFELCIMREGMKRWKETNAQEVKTLGYIYLWIRSLSV